MKFIKFQIKLHKICSLFVGECCAKVRKKIPLS